MSSREPVNGQKNPFDFLSGIQPKTVQPAEEESNPFDFLRTSLDPGVIEGAEPVETAGRRFVQNFGVGLAHPIRAFVDEENRENQGIAGALGQFAGMAVSGIALYGGAGAVLKGVGLLKATSVLGAETLLFTPLGRTAVSAVAAQGVRGAAAGAAFEAFSGETTEGAGERALKGALLGGSFDLVAAQAARAWRAGRSMGWKAVDFGDLDKIDTATPSATVHPLALKLEYAMRPNLEDTPELIATKVRLVGDPQKQLHESFMQMMRTHMPGGQAVLPGLTTKEITQLYKTADKVGQIRFSAFKRFKDEDLYDLLVVDMDRSLLTPKQLQGKASFEEMMGAVQKSFDDLNIELPSFLPNSVGRYTPKMWIGNQIAKVEVATQEPKFNAGRGVSTLIHEVMHHLQWRVAARRLGVDQGDPKWRGKADKWPVLEEMFDIDSKLAGSDFQMIKRQTALNEIRRQMDVATEEMVVHWKKFVLGTPEGAARQQAKEWIKNEAEYFSSDAERMSRLAELIFLDPHKAKSMAPMATKLIGKFIQREAPEIRQLMSREAQITLDIFNDLWRQQSGELKTVFAVGKPQVTTEMMREFGKTGWAKGLRALHNGKYTEFLGKLEGGRASIRNLDTGIEEIVDMKSLSRPLLQAVASRDNVILRALDDLVAKVPRSMPINVLSPVPGTPGMMGVQRGIVDLSNYLTVKGSLRTWLQTQPEAIQERLIQKHGQLSMIELGEIDAQGPAAVKQIALLNELVGMLGYKGIIQNDEGLMKLFVSDQNTVAFSEVFESQKFGAHISGMKGGNILNVIPNEWLKHSLRIQGVAEADMDYFYDIAMNRLGERLKGVVDPDALVAMENAAKQVAKPAPLPVEETEEFAGISALQMESGVGETTEQYMARVGLQEERLPDGRRVIRDSESKTIVAIVRSDEQVAAYAHDLGENVGEVPLVPDFPGGVSHGGNGPPPVGNKPMLPPPSPINKRTGKLTGIETFFGSWTTALENFAKRLENKGIGAAYTKVYRPAHEAMLKVQNELSIVKRDSLGGLTFGDKLREISLALVKVPRTRYPLLSGYIEALTKEEIMKPGGLLKRALTNQELGVARSIEAMGLGHDIPRLMSTDRLIDAAVSGKLESVIERMKAMKLSPEAEGLLAQFEMMPIFKSRDEVMTYLGLTNEEKSVLGIIRNSASFDKDQFSIYAVSRYASAPKLKAGFKDGRSQYAAENKMTDRELLVTRFMEEALEAGFLDSGLDAKRHLSGYFPHLRVWVQEGFHPSGEFLPPDVLEWVANRYRSGELNVFDTDPLSVVYRHLRSLYMKRYFDPVMPDINRNLRAIRANDDRAGEVMQEYVLELLGKPHDSFGRLQGAMNHMMQTVLGRKAPDRLAQDIISGLSALTSAAVIPFRPALILRNFVESALKIAPRTGVSHYFRALSYVTNNRTKKDAFEAALKAGAIRPGTQKLRSYHAAEDLFGPTAPHAVSKYLHIFDKGFEWYQSADDWGRAVAFHAQRFRVMDNLDDFVRGRISLAEFKSRAKINTFDPIDVDIAERQILAGNYEAATNHLGQVLSREAMTRYGYADHPAGWNSVQGRIFGQFGTWPVQYKDYLVQGLTRGSMKDRAEFAMIHGAMSGAVVAAGTAAGVNLSSWTGNFMYTGGPFTDLAIDVQKSISGSTAEKALARRNLYAQIPILGWMETGNPRSIFLPGSYLLGDLGAARTALEDQGVFEGVMTGLGFRVMRPQDPRPLEFIFED